MSCNNKTFSASSRAGSINGVLTVLVMKGADHLSGAGESVTSLWDLMPWCFAMGLVAGLACWVAEWLVRQKPMGLSSRSFGLMLISGAIDCRVGSL